MTKQKKEKTPYVIELESFGLSENEARVYVYLLERGVEVGGSKIAVGAKLHRQYVYTALPELLSLGLIEEVSHGKQSKYKARPPSELEKVARRRLLQTGDLVQDLNRISTVGHEQDFEMYVGDRAIQQYEHDWIKSVKEPQEQYILGGNLAGFAKLMGESLDDYLLSEKRKFTKTYYIGNTHERDLYKQKYGSNSDMETRFFETLPEGATHMVVRKDSVSFFSFLRPSLLYVIKSPVVAEDYKQFFMMLWDMAGEKL
ncbi:MAG: helix-turn-helix domain-containing protein [Patescibacteria group bacterium]